MGCRKNVARLTLAEKNAFVNALLQLKANGDYDAYVDQHFGAMSHGHGGPAFFPWHREFILRFEQALQAIDSSVNLPYWDWTVDNLNSAGTASLLWADDMMGGPGNPANNFRVGTGPFAAWNIRRSNFNIFQFPGGGGTIANFMANTNYTTFRQIEGPHGGAHVWVGGDMASPQTAPRDPVFFLLHCNVDRLWSEWIRQHESGAGFQPFLPITGGPVGHNLNDTMWPWNGTNNPFGVPPWTVVPEMRRPSDQLDHRTLGYHYDTIDPECQRKLILKERLPKELKEIVKERVKELKERPKELKDIIKEGKEIKEPKELKERLPKEQSPKELKEIREGPGGKDFRETPGGPFIRPELRPDLIGGALSFEQDLSASELEELRRELELRARGGR